MSKRYIYILGIVGLTILYGSSYGQDYTNELWTGVKIQKDFKSGLSLNINPEYRFGVNKSFNETLLETGISYEPIKFFEFGVKYRITSITEDESGNEIENQFAYDLVGKYKYNRFKFKLRTRLTNFSDFDADEYFLKPYLRYKLSADYNIQNSKFTPYASFEIFHQLEDAEINKLRFATGVEYKINKKNYISADYKYQPYLQKDLVKNIFSIQYKFKF